MLRTSQSAPIWAALVLGVVWSGCSTSEFESKPSRAIGLRGGGDLDAKGGKPGERGLGQDGDELDGDASAGDRGTGTDVAGTDTLGATGTDVATGDGGPADGAANPCRFMANPSLAEMIPNGPGLAINPNDHQAAWSREGDDIHFNLDAYKVPGEQTVQMHGGDLADVLARAGVSDQATLPDMHFKLPSTHWQLTPISIYDLHGIQRPAGLPQGTEPHYDVKYSYSVVLSNAESEECELSASLTEEPFLDRTGGGCFALSTRIRMADGKDKMIALLNVGDQVLNPVTGKATTITAITAGPEADKAMIEVGYGGLSVRVTEGHPMVTASGLKQARDLTKADSVRGEDGAFHPVTTLRRLGVDPTQKVRNLVLSPDSFDPREHMLLADGIVTGDLYLQQRLAQPEVAAAPGILGRISGLFASLLSR
jgi:hypothetical protein